MTTVFHRLTVPSYTGGLPSGYDYVNNALSGTPAFADSAKSGGPNAGTYFVAFGEDATSSDANRPANALAQNTDYLDNLLHADIALPTKTTDTGPTGSPTTSITLTGPGIFLGNVGASLVDLFHITDQNDDDIDVGGTKVVVSTITGGTVGTGFSTGNVTLNLSVAIPTGSTYHVYYGSRTNFATFPSDGLMNIRIRGAVDVDAQVEELFRLLHGNGEAWNAAWDSTVWDLTAGGLDARYRRSTTGIAGAFNTAGSGGTITRDGPAPNALSQISARSSQPDEFFAGWAAHLNDIGAGRSAGAVGSWGFVVDSHRWQTAGETGLAPSLGGFMSVWRRNATPVASSPSSGLGYWTYMPSGVTGTVTALSNGLYKLVLNSTNSPYFWKTDTGTSGNPKRSAVALLQDMVSMTNGSTVVTAMISGFDTTDVNARTALLTGLDGGNIPGFNPGPTTVTAIQWLSPLFTATNGSYASRNALDAGGSGLNPGSVTLQDGIFSVVPPRTVDTNTTDAAFKQYVPASANYFGAGTTEDATPIPAVAWGAYNSRIETPLGGSWEPLGALYNNGGLLGTNYQHNVIGNIGVTGSNQTLTLNCALFDTFLVFSTGTTTISSIVLNGLTSTSYSRIRVIFVEIGGPIQITNANAWPSNVIFSSTSTPWLKNLGNGATDVFDLQVVSYNNTVFATNVENRGLNGHIQVQNWQPQQSWSGTAGPYVLSFNDSGTGPSSGYWLIGSFAPGGSATAEVYYGTGNDTTWTQIGGAVGFGFPPTTIAVDTAGTIWVGGVVSSSLVSLSHCAAGGSFGSAVNVSFTNPTDWEFAAVGSVIVGAVGSSSGGAAALMQVQTGGVTLGQTGLTAQSWRLKSNGALAIACPQPANQTIYTTTTGLSWTAVNLGSVIGAGALIVDIAWSVEKSMWLMVTLLSAQNMFFTSKDGATWTTTGTTLTTTDIVSLTSIGKAWIGLSESGNNALVVYSYDGVTWYSGDNWIYGGATNNPELWASPTQVGMISAIPFTTTSGNLPYKFSFSWGKPDHFLT